MKSLLLPLCLSAALPAIAGTVDYPAHDGLKYSAIIIKYAQKYPQVRSGDKVIGAPVADPQGEMLAPEKLFKGLAQTRSGDNTGDPHGLNRYYAIKLPAEKQGDAKYINSVLDALATLPQIELVYPEIPPDAIIQDGGNKPQQDSSERSRAAASQSESEANPLDSTPDFTPRQEYLKDPATPKDGYVLGGINWYNVRNLPGAQGEGISIISTEVGHWDTQHADLPTSFLDSNYSGSNFYLNAKENAHDTSSVGIMVAKDNGYGVTGIVNKARIGFAISNPFSLEKAGNALKPGDVVQIGVEYVGRSCNGDHCVQGNFPMELQPAWFDVIKTLTDRGINVIALAGNSGLNLDDPAFNGKMDPAVRDSGAIIVGAVCARKAKTADFSNYGKRLTSASWGCFDIVTTTAENLRVSYDGGLHNQYTYGFSGTSSATPIVAGAAASLSGYARAKNIILTPQQVRTILNETGTALRPGVANSGMYANVVLLGWPVPPEDNSRPVMIGTQPDLVRAFQRVDSLQQ